MIASRRSFLTGLGASLILAPAIVRASSLMPVHSVFFESDISDWYQSCDPDVIGAARRRIIAAAPFDSRARTMKAIIESAQGIMPDTRIRVTDIAASLRKRHEPFPPGTTWYESKRLIKHDMSKEFLA